MRRVGVPVRHERWTLERPEEKTGVSAVSRRLQASVAAVAAVTIAVSLGLLAVLRIRETKEFCEPHAVQAYGGTNYVVQLTEAVVRKSETGCVLMVYLRLQNPNAYDVTLDRDWFVLVDRDKDYFLPSTTSPQTKLIKLPANGVLDRELLSFVVPDDAFVGMVALLVGQNYLVLVKNDEPFAVHLRNGEFRSFRRRGW